MPQQVSPSTLSYLRLQHVLNILSIDLLSDFFTISPRGSEETLACGVRVFFHAAFPSARTDLQTLPFPKFFYVLIMFARSSSLHALMVRSAFTMYTPVSVVVSRSWEPGRPPVPNKGTAQNPRRQTELYGATRFRSLNANR